jgi:hypothetical protein
MSPVGDDNYAFSTISGVHIFVINPLNIHYFLKADRYVKVSEFVRETQEKFKKIQIPSIKNDFWK